MAIRQLISFNVNNKYYGIDINQVDSIITPMEIFKVPNIPDFIEGLINLRDKVYALINLRKRFGLAGKEADENTKYIIVNADSSSAGLIIDEVSKIIHVDEEKIDSTQETLSKIKNKFVAAVADSGKEKILLLDVNKIVSPE